MPRFVLLRHECPPPSKNPKHGKPSHWDFMLESGAVLRTWELRKLPSAWAAQLDAAAAEEAAETVSVQALPLPDHRLAYLDYEGLISGDRGSVRCVDRGTFAFLQERPDRLVVELAGNLLHGMARLSCRDSCWKLSQYEE